MEPAWISKWDATTGFARVESSKPNSCLTSFAAGLTAESA